jgi:hypothetical protein
MGVVSDLALFARIDVPTDASTVESINAFTDSIIPHKSESVDCHLTADLTITTIFELGHTVLAMMNDLTHFPRLNLK